MPNHFRGSESHIQIGLIIKSKIDTNKSQGNESYSRDKISKIRTSLIPTGNKKVFPLLTGEDITAIHKTTLIQYNIEKISNT
jgi:hypothetical protein